jgi:23S rRNA G2445 N2-methylase RlmL
VEEYIHFEQKDFFSLDGEYVVSRIQSAGMEPENMGNSGDRDNSRIGKNRFLVLNPPYGKRLGLEGSYYHRLWEHIRKGFPHWKVLLLLPVSVGVSDLAGGRVLRRIVFRHGGLRVQALFFEND